MTIILLGASGMLGSAFLTALHQKKYTVHAFNSSTLDLTNEKEIYRSLQAISNPELIINCAAYTHVDLCESEHSLADALNTEAPQHLAIFCRDNAIPLIHFSTDYVFDGTKNTPYSETDAPNPINYYGLSKLRGEQHIQDTLDDYYIVRLQWLFGDNGTHFIHKMVKLAQENDTLRIVNDQFGSPSWTQDIVTMVLFMIETKPEWGIYHMNNQGIVSWFDYAKYIIKTAGLSSEVLPCPTAAFPTPAKRPLYAPLSIEKFLSLKNRPTPLSWKAAVTAYLRTPS